MKLPHQKMEVIFTDHTDIEKLIKEVYGFGYEIMPSEEVGSSQYAATYNVTAVKGVPDEWDAIHLAEWKAEPDVAMYMLSIIMDDMCNNEHIEEGTYIISVSW